MSNTNDRFYLDFISDTEDVAKMDLSNLHGASLEDFLEPFKTAENFSNISTTSSVSFNSYTQIFSEVSLSSVNQAVSGATSTSLSDGRSMIEQLQIIEQPYQSSKLRYRADYIREKSRLGVLGNKNEESKMKGPAVRIPQCYLNSNNEYYIRVSLVTIKHNKTNLRYFHPYELEHAKNKQFSDRETNSVWFPIQSKDSIINFPLLRIVKKKASHVRNLDHLRVFDCLNDSSQNTPLFQHSVNQEIDIIREYNLEKCQLAFTLGQKILINGRLSTRLYTDTTIFSDEMNENDEKQSDPDTDTESSSERSTSLSSYQYIYKYAPRSGIVGNNDEMLLYLKRKLEQKKYGDLQVIFECDRFEGRWSESIVNLSIKDRLISFKIPNFPYPITNPTTVDIILQQNNRFLGVLKYTYLPIRQ